MKTTAMQNYVFNALGPTARLSCGLGADAVKQFNDGHFEDVPSRTASPAAIKTFRQGARFAVRRPARTLRGNEFSWRHVHKKSQLLR
jgi:hypothetical protein